MRWFERGTLQSADFAVNAADDQSRGDPAMAGEFDLDTLLDTLSSGLPLWRRLVQVMSQPKQAAVSSIKAELDPHRRVDTSAFLMQRMRRISRAFEGLRERLAQPIATPSALEWRFSGPLGPAKVGRVLAESLGGPSDAAFVLAELALVISRASETVRADGVEKASVEQRFRRALDEVAAVAPTVVDDPALKEYVERAFDRARENIGRRRAAPTSVNHPGAST